MKGLPHDKMSTAFALLALVGATLILVRGTIFRPLQRLWPALFRCAQCAGVWVGGVAGATGLVDTGQHFVISALFVGAATSGAALLADAVLLHLLGAPGDKET